MPKTPPEEPAANRGENSGKALSKPPRGRPFEPGKSGNPAGRPAGRPSVAVLRQRNRDAHDVFLAELLERAAKMSFAELRTILHETAANGGLLTPDQMVGHDVSRMGALSSLLLNPQLSEQNRAAVITNFHERLKSQAEAFAEET